MKNFVFAKIGKSIKFSTKNYSPIGGDNEPSCVLRALANRNPDKKFYIIGRSDYSRLSDVDKNSLFPYDNVIDIWDGVKIPRSPELGENFYLHAIRYFEINDIHIDYGIFMIGQIGSATIPNRTMQVNNRDLTAAVIDMTKLYSTPMIEWINRTNIPFIEIINDPRYKLNQSRDITRCPNVSIGQFDFEYAKKYFKSFDDQDLITDYVKSTYSGVEKMFCLDYNKPTTSVADRNVHAMIALNEGKPSRYNILNEWVLKHDENIDIYGQWNENIINSDARFRGSVHVSEIQRRFGNVRSTFIIPIAPGWVTSKYIEMIQAGVIPFLHPTYDTQNHTNLDSFYRPSTPEQLHDRIASIYNDDVLYLHHIRYLSNKYLTDDLYDGSFINKSIMTSIDSTYSEPCINNYRKSEITTLESFFS